MYTFGAEVSNSRNGFKHTIYVYQDGELEFKKNTNYLNRTWESYQYQTAFSNAIDKMDISKEDKRVCFDIISNNRSFGDAKVKVEIYLNELKEEK